MHDSVFFEDHGKPTATVITTEFVRAADAQARALGLTGYRPVVISHPIQPLLKDEVRALADKAWEEIRARLTEA